MGYRKYIEDHVTSIFEKWYLSFLVLSSIYNDALGSLSSGLSRLYQWYHIRNSRTNHDMDRDIRNKWIHNIKKLDHRWGTRYRNLPAIFWRHKMASWLSYSYTLMRISSSWNTRYSGRIKFLLFSNISQDKDFIICIASWWLVGK